MKLRKNTNIFANTIKNHQQLIARFYKEKSRSWLNPRFAFMFFLHKNETRNKTQKWSNSRLRYDSVITDLAFPIGLAYAILLVTFIGIIDMHLVLYGFFKNIREFFMIFFGLPLIICGAIIGIPTIITPFIWISSQLLKGEPSELRIRLALTWTIACFIPFTIFSVFCVALTKTLYHYQIPIPSIIKIFFIIIIAIISFTLALYGVIALIVTLSQANRISKLCSCICCCLAIALGFLTMLILKH